jgi:hypothetical protein
MVSFGPTTGEGGANDDGIKSVIAMALFGTIRQCSIIRPQISLLVRTGLIYRKEIV